MLRVRGEATMLLRVEILVNPAQEAIDPAPRVALRVVPRLLIEGRIRTDPDRESTGPGRRLCYSSRDPCMEPVAEERQENRRPKCYCIVLPNVHNHPRPWGS